jgi:hypothetical protein
MAFPNAHGNRLWWTRERVLGAMAAAMKEISGPLPCSDAEWDRLKKGRLDWPPAVKILHYFGAMARGWRAAGAPMSRVTMFNLEWTNEEIEYLLDYAGEKRLRDIAARLRRTYPAVRRRLYELGVTARANQGFLSAAELAREYRCPYHRVLDAIAAGLITGHFDRVRNRWQVDTRHLKPQALALLNAPKTHSYQATPPDVGDYYQRHNLKRTLLNGRLIVVSKQ